MTTHDLQKRLEKSLRANLDVNGSPEYDLTWKNWAMKSGPQICALRASARAPSDKGYGGWRSPAARDWRDLCSNEKVYAASRLRHQPSVVTQAYLKGYSTCHVPLIYQRLMGYPDQWCKCVDLAMQSFRKSRRRSSKRVSKP